MSEWKKVKVGDIANLYQGLAINKKTDYLLVAKSTLPLLRIKDLQENTQEFFVNDKEAPSKCIVNEDDLVFTRTGIVGMVFNVSDWSGDLLRNDGRWKYGTPPEGNANYGWIQHFLYHLAPTGTAGFVLAKGSLTSNTSNEGEIRKALIEANLIDCIVNLPAKLFLNTQIPASIWFMKRGRTTKDILFIDSRNMGELINRRTKEFSSDDTDYIAKVYHNWKVQNGTKVPTPKSNRAKTSVPTTESNGAGTLVPSYEDVKGFCKSASQDEVRELNFVLTPGRFVGLEEVDNEFDFKERFTSLQAELKEQMQEEQVLNKRINNNLVKVVYE